MPPTPYTGIYVKSNFHGVHFTVITRMQGTANLRDYKKHNKYEN
uniref:Uncharacterized protein n=1 Tax=Rhizophora mucronata TaxID=61149 RepID=A0A2P2LC85_RHIMU